MYQASSSGKFKAINSFAPLSSFSAVGASEKWPCCLPFCLYDYDSFYGYFCYLCSNLQSFLRCPIFPQCQHFGLYYPREVSCLTLCSGGTYLFLGTRHCFPFILAMNAPDVSSLRSISI
eukprot:Gb_26859 [translate_table: standard]